MKLILNIIWYTYLPLSWTLIFLSNKTGLLIYVLYGIICFGFLFYICKLYYLNNTTLVEINYLTLCFDLMMYVYFVCTNLIVWVGIYYILNYFDPSYFIKLFPTAPVFHIVARRMTLVGAALGFSLFISSGGNHVYEIFKFTNKIAILEILFVVISFIWFMTDHAFIGMFISIVTISTMPDHIKRGIGRVMTVLFNRDIDLINIKIENNPVEEMPTRDIRGHIVTILALIIAPLINGVTLQLLMSIPVLIFGATFIVS